PVPVQVMNPASAKVEPFQVQLQTAVTGAGGSSANFTTPRNLAVDYVSVSPFGDSLAVGPFGGVLHAEIITTTGGVTARFALPFEGNNPSYVGTAVQVQADAGATVTVLAVRFGPGAPFTLCV